MIILSVRLFSMRGVREDDDMDSKDSGGKEMGNNGSDKKEQSEKIDWAHVGRLGLSSLNGVVGDYLEAEGNPLATKMGFCAQRKYIDLSEQSLTQYPYKLGNRLVIMLHGLTNLETIWNISKEGEAHDDNYASRLYQKYGYTPFFLRYNSGLNIESNGADFSRLMQSLVDVYPEPIDEIMLVGFSMGGLVIRHALHDAHDDRLSWVDYVSRCVYIGSPHDGAPLEKFGTMATSVLRRFPQEYLSHWADWIDIRSTGIQDLKHGLIADGYHGEHPYHHPEDGPTDSAYGFLPTIMHHFISGSVGKSHQSVVNYLVGDVMVRMPSALPEGAPEGSPAAHFYGTPHLRLAYSDEVYLSLEEWLAPEGGQADNDVSERPLPSQRTDDVKLRPEQVTGALSVLGTGFHQLINTVETVHLSIANEPLTILEQIPVTKGVARTMKCLNNTVTKTIYSTIKQGGDILHDTSAVVTEIIEEAERPKSKASPNL